MKLFNCFQYSEVSYTFDVFINGLTPSDFNSCPRKLTFCTLYIHFASLSKSLFSFSTSRTVYSLESCSFSLLPNTRISSIKLMDPSHWISILNIIFWNNSRAEDMPNINRLYRYKTLEVMQVVTCREFDCNSAWWKAFLMSSFVKYLAFRIFGRKCDT